MHALIGQSEMGYCAGKPMENHASSSEPVARDLRILLMFYQHPA